MERKMNKGKKGTVYYMRAFHRVLGYLCVGLVVVYAISGIVLIHRTGDFMKKSTYTEATIKPNLTSDQLGKEINMWRMKVTEENEDMIVFTDGQYNKKTGEVAYTKKEIVEPFNKFVALHMLSDGQNKHIAWLTTLFGIVLFFLAITSLFMYKPSNKQFARNMIYTGLGIVLTIVLVLLM